MSFPRYSRYKQSAIEWLGEVPEHWSQPKKLREISSLKGRLGWQGLKADEYRDEGPYVVSSAHFDDHKIQWDKCPRVSDERYRLDDNIQLAEGDILLMKDGAAMGKLAFVGPLPGPACLNSHLLLFRPIESEDENSYWPKFLFYFMQTEYFQEYIKVNGTGVTFLGISQASIGSYEIELPDQFEQREIANFLDCEIAKIDSLVAEQQVLMELLREKREAVISHAVTKGLNPRAPMMDSGVEWLGQVPMHWQVTMLKRALRSSDYGISDALEPEGAIAVLRMGNIEDGKITTDDLKYTNSVDPSLLLERGDLLYNRTNSLDLIGKVGMYVDHLKIPVSFASYLVRLRTVEASVPEFFAYLLNTPGILSLARSSAFVAIGQCNLNPTRYAQIQVPVPPTDEQRSIIIHLGNL